MFLKYSSKKSLLTIILFLSMGRLTGQPAAYLTYLHHPWVDSVLASLSTEEKIAQMIWINAGSDWDVTQYVKTDHIIRQYGIGGLVLRPGKADPQTQLINHYQSVSKIPLTCAREGGLSPYPSLLALEAIADESLRYLAGRRMARELRRLGMHAMLAPVQDVPITAGLQDDHMLILEKGGPGSEFSPLDSALIQLPGFESMIIIDTGSATGWAGCFKLADLDASSATEQIKSLLSLGKIDAQALSDRTRMILAFKYWSGLHPVPMEDFRDDKAFIRELYLHSLTVLKNEDESIPIKNLGKRKIASISLNQGGKTVFQEMAGNYTRIDHFSWFPGVENAESLLEALQSYDIVLAAVYQTGTSRGMDTFLASLAAQVQLISVFFGDPHAVDEIDGLQSSDGLILAYQKNTFTETLAAQLIFGGIGGHGRLPFSINDDYPAGHGISTPGNLRVQYAYPENAGVSSEKLNQKIDSIVLRGLEAGAYPGCAVMAARKGMVIFHKTYGFHTYDARIDVQKRDLYDLASVTKVSGPLSGLMLLEGMGKFSHLDRLGDYAPAMKGSDKAGLMLRDVLAHQSGLYPYLKYWESTVREKGNYKRRYIRNHPSEKFSIEVADRIYLKHNFRKKIYRDIKKSTLGQKEYVYSGLSFLLYPEIIENLSGEGYEDFLVKNIYRPLGAWDLVFNPHRFYPHSRIVPTEVDTMFRMQLVHGYVHDEAAAVLGGFSGNAGLFSSANDLLKLFEMYRRMGDYGGEQILKAEVVEQYTRCQFPEKENRRGLGFDKPSLGERDGTENDYPCPGASQSSFGHSGFTGTFAWTDPEHEITYVFLCNRVYPTRSNDLLAELDIRTAILQSIYDSIIE